MPGLLLILLLIPGLLIAKTNEAIFAGGCFWCMEADFDKLNGVLKTTSGYDGGFSPRPTYKEVSSSKTNYVESVKVLYDDDIISYPQLLQYYWSHIDPTAQNGQFCDKGRQYRSIIFVLNEEQTKAANDSKKDLEKRIQVFTDILPSTHFYSAEDYHQKYYQKNPLKYRLYRYLCNRDARLKEIWHE